MSSVKELSAKSKDIFAGTSLSPKEKKAIIMVASKSKGSPPIPLAQSLAKQANEIKTKLKSRKYSKLTAQEKQYYTLNASCYFIK